MRLSILLTFAAFTIGPAIAADDLLTDVFNGDGPPVTMGTDPIQHQHGDSIPEPPYGTPEWNAWYLNGINNPDWTKDPRTSGMTEKEFIDYTDNGCEGTVPCGTYLGDGKYIDPDTGDILDYSGNGGGDDNSPMPSSP